MALTVTTKIEMPIAKASFKLPRGVDRRLRSLLDKQDKGERLTAAEKSEATGLVELSEMLTLLRLKSQKVSNGSNR